MAIFAIADSESRHVGDVGDVSGVADVADVADVSALSDVTTLSDDALIELQRALAVERRRIDAHSAVVAAEIAHRSRHELGYTGLAQKRGMRTPEALVQHVTGVSAPGARTLVRVGTMVASAGEPLSGDPTVENSARMP
jgi:hypothetical protein